MNKIFLIITKSSNIAAIVVNSHVDDITKDLFDDEEIEIFELGIANPETQPNCVLATYHAQLSPCRPFGKKVR